MIYGRKVQTISTLTDVPNKPLVEYIFHIVNICRQLSIPLGSFKRKAIFLFKDCERIWILTSHFLNQNSHKIIMTGEESKCLTLFKSNLILKCFTRQGQAFR